MTKNQKKLYDAAGGQSLLNTALISPHGVSAYVPRNDF